MPKLTKERLKEVVDMRTKVLSDRLEAKINEFEEYKKKTEGENFEVELSEKDTPQPNTEAKETYDLLYGDTEGGE